MEQPQQAKIKFRVNITKLTGKLRKRSPVRLWLENRQKQPEMANAETLFSTIEHPSSNWADRVVGYYLLAGVPLSRSERHRAANILASAILKPDEGRVARECLIRVLAKTFLGCLTFFVLFDLFNGTFSTLNCLAAVCWATLLTSPFLLAFQSRHTTRILQRVAATALARVGDPRYIPLLYPHVRRTSPLRAEALQTLKAILPLTTALWYGHLTSNVVAAITELARSSDEELALMALNALEQVGYGKFAPTIQRLAERAPSPRVRERAAAVLPTLLARRARETAASTLLRPSAGNLTENLLHPVYGSDPEVSNLLRASNADSPDTSYEDTGP